MNTAEETRPDPAATETFRARYGRATRASRTSQLRIPEARRIVCIDYRFGAEPMSVNAATRDQVLTRGELAAQIGCNIETIRYYEQAGLLPAPPRSQGGHRLYGQELVKRLNFVRRSRDLGFTLEEIRGLLRLVDGGKHTCAQVEAMALDHVREIRQKISDLNKLKAVLEKMAAQCSGKKVPECPIIDALYDPRTQLPVKSTPPRRAPSSRRR